MEKLFLSAGEQDNSDAISIKRSNFLFDSMQEMD